MKNVSTKEFLAAFGHTETNYRILNGIAQDNTGNYTTSYYDKIESNLKICNDYWKKDIYFIVNNGGHHLADINRLTAQFADFDCGRLPKKSDGTGGGYKPMDLVNEWKEEWKTSTRAKIRNGEIPMPSIIVETRNGFHIYWLYYLDNTIDLSIFTPLQEAIAFKLGSDGSIKDLPRIMRLPNFFWLKHNEGLAPHLTTILSFRPEIRYSLEELQEYFPITEEQIEDSCKSISRSRLYTGGNCQVDVGTWHLQFRNEEPIEVEGFYENGQLHAACPRGCGDEKGHDIVITSGSGGFRAFCNRCKDGAFATQDKEELYFHKMKRKEASWVKIRAARTAASMEGLTSEDFSNIVSYLNHMNINTDAQEYIERNNERAITYRRTE